MSKQILAASLPPSPLVKESSWLVPSPLPWTLQHRVWVGVPFPQSLIPILPQTFWLTVLWSFGLFISEFLDNLIVLSLLFLLLPSSSHDPAGSVWTLSYSTGFFLSYTYKNSSQPYPGTVMFSIFVHLVPKAQDWHIWPPYQGTWPLSPKVYERAGGEGGRGSAESRPGYPSSLTEV